MNLLNSERFHPDMLTLQVLYVVIKHNSLSGLWNPTDTLTHTCLIFKVAQCSGNYAVDWTSGDCIDKDENRFYDEQDEYRSSPTCPGSNW